MTMRCRCPENSWGSGCFDRAQADDGQEEADALCSGGAGGGLAMSIGSSMIFPWSFSVREL